MCKNPLTSGPIMKRKIINSTLKTTSKQLQRYRSGMLGENAETSIKSSFCLHCIILSLNNYTFVRFGRQLNPAI